MLGPRTRYGDRWLGAWDMLSRQMHKHHGPRNVCMGHAKPEHCCQFVWLPFGCHKCLQSHDSMMDAQSVPMPLS